MLMVMLGVIMKVAPEADAARVVEPRALTVWGPEAEAGTVKVPLQFPMESAVIPEVTPLPS